MRVRVAMIALLAGGIGCVAASRTHAADPAPAAGGVYTAEQAKRGMGAYIRTCSACHGELFNGAESGPPLTGGEFLSHWRGKPAAELYDKIRKTMPPLPDTPGKLGEQANLDVIAVILSVNALPTGSQELAPGSLQSVPIR